MSTKAVYLISPKKVHSKFLITEAKYIIKSLESEEFIMNFTNAQEKIDVRLVMENRDELLDMFKMRFINLNPMPTLKMYGVPNRSLKDFKPKNASFDGEPPSEYRLLGEEIAG